MAKRPPRMRRGPAVIRGGGSRPLPPARLQRRRAGTPPARPPRADARRADRRGGGRRFPASPTAIFAGLGAALTAAVGGASWAAADLPWWVAYLLGINAATFALYVYDKHVAGGAALRVPEVVLHGLALGGGTPAAVLGQRLLRHKTIKASFRRVGMAIMILQAAVLIAALWLRDRLPL